MAQDIFRLVSFSVEIARHGSCEVAESDVDCHAGGALVGAGEVVGHPGYVAGEGGVDSTCCYEHSCVDYAGDVTYGGYS